MCTHGALHHHNRGRYRDLKASLHAIFRSCPPHPIGKLRGVIWQGETGQQGLPWQGLAAYRYLSDSAMSRRPVRELHVQVNSSPIHTYQRRRPNDLKE